MKKINSIYFGGPMLLIAMIIGFVIPGIIWIFIDRFLWEFSVVGGSIFIIFMIIFIIEMHQDFGKVPFYEKGLKNTIPFDEHAQYAVIKSSICTGEMLAGFKDKENGHFTEVMLIKSEEDLKRFKDIYKISDIKKEY